jgi:rod shape-determining protein MreD
VTDGLSQRLDRFARNLLPAFLSVILVLLSAVPFSIPGYGQVAANWALMAVVYWAVYRPELMPNVLAFALGLFLDILVGTPPGLNALLLVLARAVVVTQARVFRGTSFPVLWCGFALVALAAAMLTWLLSSALSLTALTPDPVLYQAGLTVALFPFLVWAQARLQNAVL